MKKQHENMPHITPCHPPACGVVLAKISPDAIVELEDETLGIGKYYVGGGLAAGCRGRKSP
jgi:hypothetical protein